MKKKHLSIELTEKQYNQLKQLIPWGTKQALFSSLVDGLVLALACRGRGYTSKLIRDGVYITTDELKPQYEEKEE